MFRNPRSLPSRLAFLVALTLTLAGCARRAGPPAVFHWWVGREAPSFDPDGPAEPVRLALERLLTRQLVSEDSLGRPTLDAAERLEVSEDRKRYTFSLRRGLRFTNGAACGSEVFRTALLQGFGRTDHGTRAWLLAAVRGAEPTRPRRGTPVLAITAPDPGTLVIELARPDSALLRKLAVPGVTSAWLDREAAGGWSAAVGLGPYKVTRADSRSMSLARASGAGPDSVQVRFALGAARARFSLRSGTADLLWPYPPALLEQPLPPGWRLRSLAAIPSRRLSLVLRADVPPTTRLAARRALAHGIARGEIVRRVGAGAGEVREWIPGGGRADLPGLDPDALQSWLERGKLGRSFHVTVAYEADQAGAGIARALQGDWSRYGLYVDLRPLRGGPFEKEALKGQAQGLLVEDQGVIAGAPGILAQAVMPMRGPAVGPYRTGWRTRDFDPWLAPRNSMPPFIPTDAEHRLEGETIVLPLCDLAWSWVEREGAPAVGFHPRGGPFPAAAFTEGKSPR